MSFKNKLGSWLETCVLGWLNSLGHCAMTCRRKFKFISIWQMWLVPLFAHMHVVGWERERICNQDRSIASQQNLEKCVLRLPTFAWILDSWESGRSCTSEHKGHSKLGVKHHYRNHFLQTKFLHVNLVLLWWYSILVVSLSFSPVSTDCWNIIETSIIVFLVCLIVGA